MKKSINFAVIAVMAISNAVSAANLDSLVYNTKFIGSADAKFVNYADASLIESELGTLQKSERSAAEKINADLQIIDAVLPAEVELKREEAPLNLTAKIRN